MNIACEVLHWKMGLKQVLNVFLCQLISQRSEHCKCRVGPLVQVSLFCWLCWDGTLGLRWVCLLCNFKLSFPVVGSWLPVRLSCRSWWSRLTLWWLTRNLNGKDRHRLWKLAWVFGSRNFPLPGWLCRKNIRRYLRFILFWLVLTCVFYLLYCNIMTEPGFQSLTLHGHVFRDCFISFGVFFLFVRFGVFLGFFVF